MPKTHQSSLFALHLLYELRNLINCSYFLKHSDDCLVGASVGRAIKSSNTTRNGTINIYSWRSQVSHCRSRTILLMICMQNKENIKGLGDDRVGFNFFISNSIQHCQKILHIIKFVIRQVKISSDPYSVSIGTNSWHSAYYSVNLLI